MEEPIRPGVNGPAVDELNVLQGRGIHGRIVDQEVDRLDACICGTRDVVDLRVACTDVHHAEPLDTAAVTGSLYVEPVQRDVLAVDVDASVSGEDEERLRFTLPHESRACLGSNDPCAVVGATGEEDNTARRQGIQCCLDLHVIVDPITDVGSCRFIGRTAVACGDNRGWGRFECPDDRDEPDDQEHCNKKLGCPSISHYLTSWEILHYLIDLF